MQLETEDFANLATSQNMETLGLSKTGLTDDGLNELGKLPALTALTIQEADISGQGAERWKGSGRLRELGLSNTAINDEGVSQVSELHDLELLGLSSTKITDESLKTISRFTKLTHLTLDNTPVTDRGVRLLADLQDLETLYLRETQVTEKQIERIYDRHPEITVFPIPHPSPKDDSPGIGRDGSSLVAANRFCRSIVAHSPLGWRSTQACSQAFRKRAGAASQASGVSRK